jgi:hypothetical protein
MRPMENTQKDKDVMFGWIPPSSTGSYPALAMAFLCFKGLGTKPLLCSYILPCAANQPILRGKHPLCNVRVEPHCFMCLIYYLQ